MWRALDLIAGLVSPTGGKLYIALYNDQGRKSRYWRLVKQSYCRVPRPLKALILYPAGMLLWGPRTLLDLVRLKPFEAWRNYHRNRGMSPWRDVVDWVGGYPFEVAKPEAVFEFLRARGFMFTKLATTVGYGNNEFVFEWQPHQ